MEKQSIYVDRWDDIKNAKYSCYRYTKELVRDTLLCMGESILGEPTGSFLTLLHCHWVLKDTKKRFHNQMQWLTDIGEFVGTDRAISMISGEEAIDGQYFHLSFDDGLKCQFNNAIPVLRKLKIPALFFITTDYISSSWSQANEYRKRMKREVVAKVMSWQDVEQIDKWGFEIGSHTRSHANLSSLNSSMLQSEILESKRDIERRINVECKYISWPFGGRKDISKEALKIVRESGYKGCFGGYRDTVSPTKTDLYMIPRYNFESYWPISTIKASLVIYRNQNII